MVYVEEVSELCVKASKMLIILGFINLKNIITLLYLSDLGVLELVCEFVVEEC